MPTRFEPVRALALLTLGAALALTVGCGCGDDRPGVAEPPKDLAPPVDRPARDARRPGGVPRVNDVPPLKLAPR